MKGAPGFCGVYVGGRGWATRVVVPSRTAGTLFPTRPQRRVRMGHPGVFFEGMGGDGGGAVGGEEEADAVALAGVEEVGEGAELGFDGGAVADEVEVVGGGFEAVEMEGEMRVVLIEEDGFD